MLRALVSWDMAEVALKELTENQKRHLRGLGHKLKPVVIVGEAGLSAGVYHELEQAIAYHELVKVRVNAEDREARRHMIEEIRSTLGAALIQSVGHVALLYRRHATKPRIQLPAA